VDALADAIDECATSTNFSGVVRVDRLGEPTIARAYRHANRAASIPNTVDTVFAAASATKSLTALAVVRLIERGEISLSTNARSVLGDDLPLIDASVTVEHLLAHRSGIGDYLDEDAGLQLSDYLMPVPVQDLATTEQFVPVLDGHPQKFAPGSSFSYCNAGFVVLALIAERVSGTPFHDLVETEVCARAGMRNTSFLRSDELPGGVAIGYLDGHRLRTNVFHLPVRGNGDGGIYTTLDDVHAFWRALYAGDIVARTWVDTMTAPHSDVSPSMQYGYGFWIQRAGGAARLEGNDAGVSFLSACDRDGRYTHTVIGNDTEGAWPLARLLVEHFAR